MTTELLILSSQAQSFTLEAWGDNPFSQLGLDSHRFGFAQLTTGALSTQNFVQIESTGYGFLALTSGGNLYGWGLNELIGAGSSGYTQTPTLVLSNVQKISVSPNAGDYGLSIALKTDGTIWLSGRGTALATNSYGRTAGFNAYAWEQSTAFSGTYVDVAVSSTILSPNSWFLALRNDNTVWAIGNNGNGQLGQNNTTSSFSTPVQVKDSAGTGFLSNIVSVAAGNITAYAVASSGSAYGWGNNSNGKIGDNTTTQRLLPVLINYSSLYLAGGPLTTVTKIVPYISGAYAIIQSGTGPSPWNVRTNLYGWGGQSLSYELTSYWYGSTAVGALPIYNPLDQNGVPLPWPLTAVEVMGTGDPIAGSGFSDKFGTQAVIDSSGRLLTWGGNPWGEVGRSEVFQWLVQDFPRAVDANNDWVKVCSACSEVTKVYLFGQYMSFAIKADSKIYGSGANTQFSFATTNKYNSPTQVGNTRGWLSVSNANDTTLFITNTAELFGVGKNDNNQLGQNNKSTQPFSLNPFKLTTGTWKNACTTGLSSAALDSNGTLYTWGSNTFGQCGNGTTTEKTSISAVTNFGGGLPASGNKKLSCGGNTTIAGGASFFTVLGGNGKVYCAGDNGSAQCGTGGWSPTSTVLTFSPVQDYRGGDLQDVIALYTCNTHTFVELSVGDPSAGGNNIFFWGNDTYGQSGNLTTGASNMIASASPSSAYNPGDPVIFIAGGQWFSVILHASGAVETAGYNSVGQLGNGTLTNVSVFQPVVGPGGVGTLTNILHITALDSSVIAVRDDGNVYAWGSNRTSGSTESDPGLGMLVPSDNSLYFTAPTLVGNISNINSLPNLNGALYSAFLLRDV